MFWEKNNFQLKNSQAHRTNWIKVWEFDWVFSKNIGHFSEFLAIMIHGAWQILATNWYFRKKSIFMKLVLTS